MAPVAAGVLVTTALLVSSCSLRPVDAYTEAGGEGHEGAAVLGSPSSCPRKLGLSCKALRGLWHQMCLPCDLRAVTIGHW